MLDLVFKNITSEKEYGSQFFEKILVTGIKELKLGNPAPSLSANRHSERVRAWSGASKSIEISVNIVGDSKIKEMNSRYRHKNKVTDVLSFPLETKPVKNSEIWPLGDIFICLSFAKKQAKSENVGIDKKLTQLTVHGFLHLLGYDHEKSDMKAKEMFDLEEKILSKISGRT